MEEQRKRPRIFPIEEVVPEKIFEPPKGKGSNKKQEIIYRETSAIASLRIKAIDEDISRFKILAIKKRLNHKELFKLLLDTIENS